MRQRLVFLVLLLLIVLISVSTAMAQSRYQLLAHRGVHQTYNPWVIEGDYEYSSGAYWYL